MTKVIPFADYAAIDAVNWSTLKEMRRSPKHYRYRLDVPREDTKTLAVGRAVHTAVFEPDRFLTDYTLFDHENKGGKVVRNGKVWDAFRDANAGRTILTPAEYARALAIRDAVRAHPKAASYLKSGAGEQYIKWRDDESGLNCKARLDFIPDHSPVIVDLKSTASIVYGIFAATAARLGYHRQLGFYRRGFRVATGETRSVIVIAVEANAPHDVAVFEYSEDALHVGESEVQSLLVQLAFCRERDLWPGMYPDEQVLELPEWATPDANDLSDLELETGT